MVSGDYSPPTDSVAHRLSVRHHRDAERAALAELAETFDQQEETP
jgi:hypothetical protein